MVFNFNIYINKKFTMENKIDKSIVLLRELQTILFDDAIDGKDVFKKTLQLQDMLNDASVQYHEFLNEKEKNN